MVGHINGGIVKKKKKMVNYDFLTCGLTEI